MIPRKNYFRDISPIWTLHFPIQDSSANSSIPAAAPVPAEFDAAQVSFESTTRGVQTPDLPAPGGEPGQPPLQPQHEDDLLPLHTTPGAKQAKEQTHPHPNAQQTVLAEAAAQVAQSNAAADQDLHDASVDGIYPGGESSIEPTPETEGLTTTVESKATSAPAGESPGIPEDTLSCAISGNESTVVTRIEEQPPTEHQRDEAASVDAPPGESVDAPPGGFIVKSATDSVSAAGDQPSAGPATPSANSTPGGESPTKSPHEGPELAEPSTGKSGPDLATKAMAYSRWVRGATTCFAHLRLHSHHHPTPTHTLTVPPHLPRSQAVLALMSLYAVAQPIVAQVRGGGDDAGDDGGGDSGDDVM